MNNCPNLHAMQNWPIFALRPQHWQQQHQQSTFNKTATTMFSQEQHNLLPLGRGQSQKTAKPPAS
jgi:hypothetical protein